MTFDARLGATLALGATFSVALGTAMGAFATLGVDALSLRIPLRRFSNAGANASRSFFRFALFPPRGL